MKRLPVPSTGRRFLKHLGFALAWAAVFGAVLGGLAYDRLPRTAPEEGESWHESLRRGFDRIELAFFDWRVRELGKGSERSDQVVVVAIDDDALASAREDSSHGLSAYPWPREVLGALSGQLAREGASLVLLDLPFPDLSPRGCAPTGAAPLRGASDDDTFRGQLEQLPSRPLLTFGWAATAPRAAERDLQPFLLFVDNRAGLEDARVPLQKLLAERVPAYLIPDGKRFQLWAGAASEQRARELADRWALPAPRRIRLRLASEQGYEIPRWRLLASLAEVHVEGLDPSLLPRVRSLESPVPVLLSEHSRYGSATATPDFDGVLRSFPHLTYFAPEEGKGYVLPSVPLAAAMSLAGSNKLVYRNGQLEIGGKYKIPLEDDGQSLLRWDAAEVGRSAKGSLRRSISAWKLLVNLFDHSARPGLVHHDNELTGKVAILTNTSMYGPGPRLTAVGSSASGAVIGQALVNILRSEGIHRAPPQTDFFATVALAFVGALLAMVFFGALRARAGKLAFMLSLSALSAIYLFAARALFLQRQEWVAVALPLLSMWGTFAGARGYGARLERRLRKWVTRVLGSVSPEIARLVARDVGLMHPERRPVTLFRADLEGISGLVETLDPALLVALLNEFFTEMTAEVTRTGGHVDSYIGDALVAFWGAPVRMADHAGAACRSALAMRAALEKRRPDWEKRFGRKLDFRAGICSGDGVAGDMGSAMKSNYTVIGEAAGLVTSFEGANKRYGTRVLCGGETARQAGDAFVFREVDRWRSEKGGSPIALHELMGRKGQLTAQQEGLLSEYQRAVGLFHKRQFVEALAAFQRCVSAHGDGVSEIYVKRCQRYREAPPPEGWDGSHGRAE